MLDIKYGSVACICDPGIWEAKARNQKFKVIHSSKTSLSLIWAARNHAPLKEKNKEKNI